MKKYMLSFLGVVLSGIFLASFEKAEAVAVDCSNESPYQWTWMCTQMKATPTEAMLNLNRYVENVKKAKEAIN